MLAIIKHFFSITKSNDKRYKIITIFGIKIKYNRLKGEKKKEDNLLKKLKKEQSLYPKDSYLLFDCCHDDTVECIDAYSLFCYMKERGIKAYYVLQKTNQLYQKLTELNKLDGIIGIENSSKTHPGEFLEAIYNTLLYTKCVVTSFGENSQIINRFFKSNPYWQYIFIQHGPTYLKQSVMNNSYIYPQKFDKFLISSENERHIFLNSGFKDDKFIKVGFPRWDLLNTNDNLKEKSILFMFTWRKLDQQKFEKSMYKKNLLSLLHNQQLLDYLKNNNIKLYFAPHHALKMNSKIDFNIAHDNIEEISSTKISEAIKNCSMLVTDFSSVSFDFMFQDKPVICYGLDLDDAVLSQHERNDLRAMKFKQQEFPNILFSEQDVINKIKYYVENNFKVEEENLQKYQKFFYTKENIREQLTEELEKICS